VAGTIAISPVAKAVVQYEANENDNIAYVTMFGYSNDWFYGNKSNVSAAHTGDIGVTELFDNGTAVSQYPGAGNLQNIFGGTSEAEDKVIATVDVPYSLPKVAEIINVNIR